MTTISSETENSSKKHIVPSYSDQCYFVDNIGEISSWKNPKTSTLDSTLNNLILASPGQSNSVVFLNRLTRSSNAQEFLNDKFPSNIKAQGGVSVSIIKELANGFQHKIYPLSRPKVNKKKISAKSVRKMIPADVKSVSWDFLGTQPAEVDYFINCSIDITFKRSQEFFEKRDAEKSDWIKGTGSPPSGYKWRYKDLIVRPRTKIIKDDHLIKDQKHFRILLKIDYLPGSSKGAAKFMRRGASQKSKDAAKSLKKRWNKFTSTSGLELYLSLLKNTVEIKAENPMETKFNLTLEYNGAVESAFLSPRANVLLPPETSQQKAERERYEQQLDALVLNKLQNSQLSDSQKEKLKSDNMTMGGVKGRADEASYGWTSDSDVLDQLEDELVLTDEGNIEYGDDALDTEDQAEIAQEFLIAKNELKVKYHQDQKANALAAAYSRILNSLHQKKKIYYIKRSNEALLNWFKTRSKVKHLSKAQIKDLEEKRAKGDMEGKLAGEQLEDYYKNRTAARDVLKSESAALQAKPASPTDPNQEKALMADKTKKIAEFVNSHEAGREEKYKQLQSISNLEDPVNNEKERVMMFFYFGDMLDTVVDFLQDNSKALGLTGLWHQINNRKGKVKFILGDIEYSEAATNVRKSVNIADVPISVELWDAWWHSTVVRRLAENYPFKAFLRDSLVSLVKNAFTNRCKVPGQTINQVRLNVDHIPYYGNRVNFSAVGIPGTGAGTTGARTYASLTQAVHGGDIAGEMVYIYATTNSPGFFTGNRRQDSENGIYHITATGGQNSVLNAMTFSKVDQPFLLEAKAEKSGVMKDDLQLSEPYNANMSCAGLSIWRPGRYVYLTFNPTWFTPNQATTLGLGGYYMINKVSNKVELSGPSTYKWTSNVDLRWTQFSDMTRASMPVYDIEQSVDDARMVFADHDRTSGPGQTRTIE